MSNLRTLHTQVAIIGGHLRPIRGLQVGRDFLIVADEEAIYYYQRPYENEDSYNLECTFQDVFGGHISCMTYSISHNSENLYVGTTSGGINIIRLKSNAGKKRMLIEYFFYIGKATIRRLQWLQMSKILVITAQSPNIYLYVPLLRQVFSRKVSDKNLTHSYLDELTETLYVSDMRDYVKVFNIPLSNPGLINHSAAVRGSSLFISVYEGNSHTSSGSAKTSVVHQPKTYNYFQKPSDCDTDESTGANTQQAIQQNRKSNFTKSTLNLYTTADAGADTGNDADGADRVDDAGASNTIGIASININGGAVHFGSRTPLRKHSNGGILSKISGLFRKITGHDHVARYRYRERHNLRGPQEIGMCLGNAIVPDGANTVNSISVITSTTGSDAVYVPCPIAALGMNAFGAIVQSAHKKSVRIFLVDTVNGLLFTGGDDKVVSIWNIEALFVSGESYIIDTSNFNYSKATALAFSPQRLVFFTADETGAINVFDANNLLIVNTWLAHSGPINGIFLDDEEGLLYTYGSDGLIKVWRVWIRETECLALRRSKT